jgi:LacI family transcriptional regulator
MAPPQILLLIETSSAFARRLIRGVAAYCHGHGRRWVLRLREGGADTLGGARWNPAGFDGVIARLETQKIADTVSATGLPAVNVSGTPWDLIVPWVDTDNSAVANLVVEYFGSRGFRHFAFCGVEAFPWSQTREQLLAERLVSDGLPLDSFSLNYLGDVNDPRRRRRLLEWLVSLSKPVALMACNDMCGRLVIDACAEARLSVPDEVAVMGVDNDELVCELSDPSLSSVIPNTEKIGHMAASVLDRLLVGRPVESTTIKVDPIGIETRRSTDATAIGQPLIRLALRFIHSRATDGINVENVLGVVPISRTALENGFREFIGRTPHAEITRVRLRCAQRLLTTTTLSVSQIAARCGYERAEYFSSAFRRETGLSPSEFRRQKTS